MGARHGKYEITIKCANKLISNENRKYPEEFARLFRTPSQCLESIKAHDDAINGLVCSSKNGVVFSASADGKIKAWSKEEKSCGGTHSLKGILEGHKDVSLNSVVVSQDGNFVYGGGSDGYLMGWLGNKNLDSWKLVCEVKARGMVALRMCLIKGEFLCSGSADKSICIWKREINGGLFRVGVIKGHEGPIKCSNTQKEF
ncbi:PREDICTED: myosin heavy chain kinase D-like [Nicotiana attenuata]|uniref:myosin heavy chain kinase D-like n=1 Tax=Nicotiana attenuata TaxID=49451 RepID=UPI000904C032|nr:PREDICTED: myosin heavy chain kinase D-like [Nicotiana attenuata]